MSEENRLIKIVLYLHLKMILVQNYKGYMTKK